MTKHSLTGRGRQPRILVVDDDESFRYATKKMLVALGYSVVTAPDYRQALDVITGNEPLDLLVTDIVMPNRVNGFALARMATMRRREMPVLYVTAFDVPAHEAIGKVLRKPITEAQLLAEINQAIAA